MRPHVEFLQRLAEQSIEREPPRIAERSPKADVVLGGAQPAQRHDIVVDQSARRSLTAVRMRCSSCCRQLVPTVRAGALLSQLSCLIGLS